MTPFDNATLIAYTLGQLSPAMSAEVSRAADTDAELAAKLEVLGLAAGCEMPPAPGPNTTPRAGGSRRRFFRALAASVGGVALLGGAAYAGYELLREKPLLEDNFRDGWLDSRIWDTSRGRKGVREEGGHLRLLNRGSVVSQAAFDDPIEVELDWQWLDLESDPMYTDNLSVGLRTTGTHEREHAYKLLDGVVIDFNSHRGAVYVYNAHAPASEEKISPWGEVKFAAGKWYHLRVTDDGKRVAVYVSGPEIDRKHTTEPVIAVDLTGKYHDRRVAFFNREHVGGANHESRIDNVVVRKLVGK